LGILYEQGEFENGINFHKGIVSNDDDVIPENINLRALPI
jgi:hypothetical protein